MVAHFDGGVPCLGLKVPELSEHCIGAPFAFFEVGCALSAAMLGVNAYDRPNVEVYKNRLFALLDKPGTEALGAHLRDASLEDRKSIEGTEQKSAPRAFIRWSETTTCCSSR
jgi:glucose-6-phosphate isomerase